MFAGWREEIWEWWWGRREEKRERESSKKKKNSTRFPLSLKKKTFQVVAANLDGGAMFAGPSVKPIGGNIMVRERD